MSVEKIVRSHLLENWESQNDPTHLKTIRGRILKLSKFGLLLGFTSKFYPKMAFCLMTVPNK